LRLHEGSLFGEMEYFEPSPSLATVVAVTDCEIISIEYEALRRITASNPQLLIQLNRGFLKTLTEKHRLVTDSLIEWKSDSEPFHRTSPAHRPSLSINVSRNRLSAQSSTDPQEGLPSRCPIGAVGNSKPLKQLRTLIARIQGHQGNVLILGEAGVGKELVASALARSTQRETEQPFVAVDSATLTSSTVESILFGHEKGAFTGAERRHIGLFERANNGVVYFDEIGNMPLDVQAKLLRVVQEKQILRVGGTTPIPLKFRVIAATNIDLEEACHAGTFRFDLYSRLSVFELHVAPLRERREDIPLLLEHFLCRYGSKETSFVLAEDARQQLVDYHWPGNIRELKNAMEYAVAMADGGVINADSLPPKIAQAISRIPNERPRDSLRAKLEHAEKSALMEVYQQVAGNVSELARTLKTDRSSVYKKLKQYGIHGH
jgi:DNA-binding NtrC family response regulator